MAAASLEYKRYIIFPQESDEVENFTLQKWMLFLRIQIQSVH